MKVPDDWKQQQTVFANSLVVLPRLIEAVEPERLNRAPAPGGWSARVVICHLLLDEMNTAMILRLILFEALRRRLWGLSPRRLPLDDGYPVPGSVLGVDVQKLGAIIERRVQLDFYDNTHTVSIEQLEALLPESIAR